MQEAEKKHPRKNGKQPSLKQPELGTPKLGLWKLNLACDKRQVVAYSLAIGDPISCNTQRAPNPPEFAQPLLSRSNGGHPQRDGANLGVLVPVWLVLTPARRCKFGCV